jgi:hypothetical protein
MFRDFGCREARLLQRLSPESLTALCCVHGIGGFLETAYERSKPWEAYSFIGGVFPLSPFELPSVQVKGGLSRARARVETGKEVSKLEKELTLRQFLAN